MQHLIAVIDSRRGMEVARSAAHLASDTESTITMALLIRPPWIASMEPSAMECWRNGDIEIDALIRLSVILDPYGIPWRMVSVTGGPARAITALARSKPPRWVLLRKSRLATTLRAKHGLPLLLV